MKIESINLKESDLFSSIALVFDKDKDPKEGQIVALILYSEEGNIVYLHDTSYNVLELMVKSETFFGETIYPNRFKVYKATVIPASKITDKGEIVE